jgi:hypothetical protein
MPVACREAHLHGSERCLLDCPLADVGAFEAVRVESAAGLPAADPRTVDVAILDMNHGWPNLGHDCLVHAVREAACDLLPALEETGLRIRTLSYDVRRRGLVPEGPGGRFAVYLGTGGPGHVDPRQNDGVSPSSQGVAEDPSWEEPLYALFVAIQRSDDAALLAVCHTFGVLCRWSGVARPVLRGPEKGGKALGVLENVLTEDGARHPWFSRLAAELPDGHRLRVVENRLFDLLPVGVRLPAGLIAIGREPGPTDGPAALTMLELARDPGGVMPRMFAVNHHPEIVDRSRQMMLLKLKRDRGEVSREWYEERAAILTQTHPDEDSDRRLQVTSDYTLLAPLRYHLHRQLRRRAAALGRPVAVHEDRILDQPAGAPW